jgi:hypothetical protein
MTVKEKVVSACQKVPFIRPPQGRGTQTFEGFILHFPIGLLAGALIWEGSVIGIVFGIMILVVFYGYEAIEDWIERDRSYRDVFGALVGVSVMGLAYLCTRIWQQFF